MVNINQETWLSFRKKPAMFFCGNPTKRYKYMSNIQLGILIYSPPLTFLQNVHWGQIPYYQSSLYLVVYKDSV